MTAADRIDLNTPAIVAFSTERGPKRPAQNRPSGPEFSPTGVVRAAQGIGHRHCEMPSSLPSRRWPSASFRWCRACDIKTESPPIWSPRSFIVQTFWKKVLKRRLGASISTGATRGDASGDESSAMSGAMGGFEPAAAAVASGSGCGSKPSRKRSLGPKPSSWPSASQLPSSSGSGQCVLRLDWKLHGDSRCSERRLRRRYITLSRMAP